MILIHILYPLYEMDIGVFDDEFCRRLVDIFINDITIHLKSASYGQRRTFIHHLLHAASKIAIASMANWIAGYQVYTIAYQDNAL